MVPTLLLLIDTFLHVGKERTCGFAVSIATTLKGLLSYINLVRPSMNVMILC